MPDTTTTIHWKRRLAQIAALAVLGEFAFYGIFRCPFAVPYVGCGNCPVMQCPGRKWYLPIWGAILASAILFGRAFCGWACPGGLMADLLGKMTPIRRRLTGLGGALLHGGKYVVLAAALLTWLVWSNPRWAVPIRTGQFFESIGLTFEHAKPLWLWRSGVMLAAIVLGVAFSHVWCRFLCPTGGVLELFNRIALFRYRKRGTCNDCGACTAACALGTRPAEANCTDCGDCVPMCPVRAIGFGGKPRHTPGAPPCQGPGTDDRTDGVAPRTHN
jgi:ferredoxin-type protein NapH